VILFGVYLVNRKNHKTTWRNQQKFLH
jgi:hypothetical protein